MKKVFLAILISVLCFIPFSVNAEEKEYKTLNLDEALKEEAIDHDFSNYKETDDQAIIYLFRGKGCAYCKKFLTYLNISSLTPFCPEIAFETVTILTFNFGAISDNLTDPPIL